jgi:hypothetical protein
VRYEYEYRPGVWAFFVLDFAGMVSLLVFPPLVLRSEILTR